MTRVLFLCTGNSCRSQMAEGWTRALHHDRFEASSAGTEARGLDHRAVQVMLERGVDISAQRSTRIDEIDTTGLDLVVTVCGHAAENCPVFPRACRVLHAAFDDPPALAEDARTDEQALDLYRRVRDEIRRWVETLPELV